MAWFDADPGGAQAFGVALLRPDGSFASKVVSCADEALEWFGKPTSVLAAGIDAPLWWSSRGSGDRKADQYLRDRLRDVDAKHVGGTIQAANSLRGAVLIQGVMLAMGLRRQSRELLITEAHPKALLKATWPHAPKNARQWNQIAEYFGLKGETLDVEREHERDALLAAVAAREGSAGQWTHDLALCPRPSGEQDPAVVPWGPVHYWWPKVATKRQ